MNTSCSDGYGFDCALKSELCQQRPDVFSLLTPPLHAWYFKEHSNFPFFLSGTLLLCSVLVFALRRESFCNNRSVVYTGWVCHSTFIAVVVCIRSLLCGVNSLLKQIMNVEAIILSIYVT